MKKKNRDAEHCKNLIAFDHALLDKTYSSLSEGQVAYLFEQQKKNENPILMESQFPNLSDKCKELIIGDRAFLIFSKAGLVLSEKRIAELIKYHSYIFNGCSCCDDSVERLQELDRIVHFENN